MWNWKYKQIFILFIVLVLFLQCGCAKKKKKAKKPKLKYPATILQASNRTHFAIAPTCNARIEILKKNETEDLELGLGKNTVYGDLFPEHWEDFPYPPVSPEQIKKEKKYYKYLSKNDTTEKKRPLLYANDMNLTTINHFLYEGEEDYE